MWWFSDLYPIHPIPSGKLRVSWKYCDYPECDHPNAEKHRRGGDCKAGSILEPIAFLAAFFQVEALPINAQAHRTCKCERVKTIFTKRRMHWWSTYLLLYTDSLLNSWRKTTTARLSWLRLLLTSTDSLPTFYWLLGTSTNSLMAFYWLLLTLYWLSTAQKVNMPIFWK